MEIKNRSKIYIGVLLLMPLGFLVALLFNSCKKESVDTLSINCSAALKTPISFKLDVYPIIKTNCLNCHDSKNHFGGIIIETYDQLASSAKVGELLNSVTPLNGNPPYMPKGSRLSDCEIQIIKNWVIQGFANN